MTSTDFVILCFILLWVPFQTLWTLFHPRREALSSTSLRYSWTSVCVRVTVYCIHLYTCIGAWCIVVYYIYMIKCIHNYILYIYILCNFDVVFFAALKGFAAEAAHEEQP